MPYLIPSISLIFSLLFVEFTDELVFGAREAAWPLIRNDIGFTYIQLGLLLSVPNIISNFIEPLIGILGDVWNRKLIIFGGGFFFVISLIIAGISKSFWSLLVAFIIFYPASGAFVSLSQASLMDIDPGRREHNMARWTFIGSLGIVLGPLLLGSALSIGWHWRKLFFTFACLAVTALIMVLKSPVPMKPKRDFRNNNGDTLRDAFLNGLKNALTALKKREVLRWLTILSFSDLVMDIFHGFLALYFVDIIGTSPMKAVLMVVIWTGSGLVGDLLLIPLLETVNGLEYLRISSICLLVIYPLFLLIPNQVGKAILIGFLGLLTAGWYAIPKGHLYSTMPNQSGSVMAVSNIFNIVGSIIPLGIGIIAEQISLQFAMWIIILGPLAVTIGLPSEKP